MLFLALWPAGCTKRIDFGPTGEVRSVDELLRLTERAELEIATVKGDARLRISSPKRGGTLNVFVAAARPDKLHLESLNFFGKPQAILASAGSQFELLDADTGKFYRGPASRQNLARFVPVAIPAEQLMMMLLGQAPRIRASSQSLSVDPSQGLYVVKLSNDSSEQVLWIGPSDYRVRRSQVKGADAYELTFDDFQSFASTAYPSKATFTEPTEGKRLELKYREVNLNEALPPSFFQLAPPAGVEIIDVDEEGNPRSASEARPNARLPSAAGQEKR
jgi:outer membrane lipoprotein-sorting protein